MATAMMIEPATSTQLLDDSGYEVVDGQRVELPPMASKSTRVASVLIQHLGPFAMANGLGRVDVEMLYRIDDERDLQRRPDVAFVSFDRWPRGKEVSYEDPWDVVPDLAIEVVSPSNRADELLGKIHDYFRVGVRAVWVAYPKYRIFHIFASFEEVRVLSLGADLDGGAILPEFRVPLATVFEVEMADEGRQR